MSPQHHWLGCSGYGNCSQIPRRIRLPPLAYWENNLVIATNDAPPEIPFGNGSRCAGTAGTMRYAPISDRDFGWLV
jgi:hypothetical protein